jgi:phosphohistidine phosphatase
MNLFILRHASAGTRRANPLLDLKRPLDKEGKQHCLHLAHLLNALKINFDLVVSSPLKRSLQTAQLVATETGYETQILQSKALAPEASVADFHRLLQTCRDRENLLVVGHNPNLQLFLGSLLVADPRPLPHIANGAPALEELASPQVRLRKGSIARLSLTRRPATLQALLDPRLVRALYATSTKSSRRKTSRK